ncbi:hypothetical protein B0J14DRAFT_438562, partial [Halenospora varia]
YATLGHCWGKGQHLTLRNVNIDDLKRKIYLTSLPRTFADAVDVCRHLGVWYLWIISLCIVQNSKDDWQRECALMESVYSDDILTFV